MINRIRKVWCNAWRRWNRSYCLIDRLCTWRCHLFYDRFAGITDSTDRNGEFSTDSIMQDERKSICSQVRCSRTMIGAHACEIIWKLEARMSLCTGGDQSLNIRALLVSIYLRMGLLAVTRNTRSNSASFRVRVGGRPNEALS